jgi:histidine ammonia-lyase
MKKRHAISTAPLDASFFHDLLKDTELELSADARQKIDSCRKWLDQKLASSQVPVYGINTGFGSLYDKQIPQDQMEQLQVNLMVSHACGTGARVPDEIVRLMLFLKIQSLSYGYSGINSQTAEYLIQFFNAGITPEVFEFGSLGASGDLAPLAHLCLPLIGKGKASVDNKTLTGTEMLKQLNLSPLRLQSKEGLALLNGTQFMSAYGVWCLVHAKRLLNMATTIGALSLEAFDGRADAFDERVHMIRPHAGQLSTAEHVRKLLQGSELQAQPKKHVQDPYSFRCIPQVHGASADTINYVEQVLLTEINSVTDNPNIFHEDDTIISGGNFHGQPLALAMDFLAIALAELGNISERRTYQLISGSRQLPNYLVREPGINSGMMILQYTAAGIVSRNKQLCAPASVDSIVSSNGQEDHVSMGANAASRTRQVVENLYSILAIELITAAQAITFRRPLKTSPALESLISNFRQHVSFLDADRVLHDDMKAAEAFLKNQLINT